MIGYLTPPYLGIVLGIVHHEERTYPPWDILGQNTLIKYEAREKDLKLEPGSEMAADCTRAKLVILYESFKYQARKWLGCVCVHLMHRFSSRTDRTVPQPHVPAWDRQPSN